MFYIFGLCSVGDYRNLDEIKQIEGSFVVPFVNLDGQNNAEDIGNYERSLRFNNM